MIPIAKQLLGEEEKQAALEVLSSGMLAQGFRSRLLSKPSEVVTTFAIRNGSSREGYYL